MTAMLSLALALVALWCLVAWLTMERDEQAVDLMRQRRRRAYLAQFDTITPDHLMESIP